MEREAYALYTYDDPYYTLGCVAMEFSLLEEASRLFKLSIQQGSESHLAWFHRGVCESHLSHIAEAKYCFNRVSGIEERYSLLFRCGNRCMVLAYRH